MTQTILPILNNFLTSRLDVKALSFVNTAQEEIHAGVVDARFSALIALASRYIPRRALSPTAAELNLTQQTLAGWSPKDWSVLESVRVAFVLSRSDLLCSDFGDKFNGWFNFADEGESCAYYRAIPLLPEPQQFVWRAAEGCRTNMRSVFMAVACDSPYPSQYFDELVWNQLVVKALFTETPLWRVYGLDQRLSATLAVMVLDYMDERSSAGRAIPLDAWLCLGEYSDARVDAALQTALNSGEVKMRCAAILALARAKRFDRLQQIQDQQVLDKSSDPCQGRVIQQALTGTIDQVAFQAVMATIES